MPCAVRAAPAICAVGVTCETCLENLGAPQILLAMVCEDVGVPQARSYGKISLRKGFNDHRRKVA